MSDYRFTAPLWRWRGDGAWHFVTLPVDVADEIEERTADTRRGFGSVRVRVTIGTTTWDTSVFPDTKAESYVLPVKSAVRKAEAIAAGDAVPVELSLADAGAARRERPGRALERNVRSEPSTDEERS